MTTDTERPTERRGPGDRRSGMDEPRAADRHDDPAADAGRPVPRTSTSTTASSGR